MSEPEIGYELDSPADLRRAIVDLMTCAPQTCPREMSCFRVAKFAAAVLQESSGLANQDAIIDGLCAQFVSRSQVWRNKLAGDELELLDWLEKTKIELMDAVLCGEAAIRQIEQVRAGN